jgi:hypothetical protein
MDTPNHQIKKAPHFWRGIRTGTKRAAVYDYLARRVEATVVEVTVAMGDDPLFDDDIPTRRKDVGDIIRHMTSEGLLASDPPRYRVNNHDEHASIAFPEGVVQDEPKPAPGLPPGIECIPVYKTPDGIRFDTPEQAIEHLKNLELSSLIEKFLAGHSDDEIASIGGMTFLLAWEDFKSQQAHG